MAKGVTAWLCGCLVVLLSAGAVPVAYAQLPGDSDCDGQINGNDVDAAILRLFDEGSVCSVSDINADGRVSSADVVSSVGVVTAPPPQGPRITYLGLAGADGAQLNPIGTTSGIPVFTRSAGSQFKLVVEARAGINGVQPGHTLANSDPLNPNRRPDLWVVSSSPLGDGSPAVCDGGVPAVSPPSFALSQAISNALNDLACNFTFSTSTNFACTQDSFGSSAFVDSATQAQYCLQVIRALAFPDADTLLTVLVRDSTGTPGPPRQLILRVGIGPFATYTPTPTPTRVLATSTPTLSRSPTFTHTPTYTVRATSTRTPTRSPSITKTPMPTPTSPPPTATRSFTPSATRSPSVTPSLTPVRSTATQGSPTPPPGSSATPSRTSTRTATATLNRSNTPTRSPTRSPTMAPGPIVTFFGLTRSDDTLVQPSATSPEGIPIYAFRTIGFGFSMVVEAKRGPGRLPVGSDSFVDTLDALPDLQIVSSNPLGNGSEAVCDSVGAGSGGVPALNPVSFDPTETNIRIINDLACRFVDGGGFPVGRGLGEACTRVPPNDEYQFVAPNSVIQFCASVSRALELPPGETLLTVRLLDQEDSSSLPGSGAPGGIAQIIVRVGDVIPPSETPTVLPSPTPSPTRTATRTLTGQANPTPSRTPTPSGARSPTATASRSATRTMTRTRTASPSATPTSGEITGPIVTFVGVARFDGTPIDPIGTAPDGAPIYRRPVGAGFILIVEGRPGSSRKRVGASTLANDSFALPDLQIVASQSLGDGSSAVCDYMGPNAGGVPAVVPPDFDLPDNAPAINDLACRFRDGAGSPSGRGPDEGCILFPNGDMGFARKGPEGSTLQFCAQVDTSVHFPDGDTVISVRLRDEFGNVGALSSFVLRIGL
jgi:hypothetical protein